MAKRIAGLDEGEDHPAGDMALSDLVDVCEAVDPAAATSPEAPLDRDGSTDVAMDFLSAQADVWMVEHGIHQVIGDAAHAGGPHKDKLASAIDGLVRQAFVGGAYLGRTSLEDFPRDDATGPSFP